MPSALPGLSAAKASALLQQTDRLIKTVPEVRSVFGKAGRAETATDPAPLEMFETPIQFKPRDQWRPGMTPAKLVAELDRTVQVPGLTNGWVPPIRNRIDMQHGRDFWKDSVSQLGKLYVEAAKLEKEKEQLRIENNG